MMARNNAQGLQAAISKETIALLTLFGTDAEVQHYKEDIRLIQKAWEIPDADTQPWLDAIGGELELAKQGSPEHVFPEEELPILETEEKINSLQVAMDNGTDDAIAIQVTSLYNVYAYVYFGWDGEYVSPDPFADWNPTWNSKEWLPFYN